MLVNADREHEVDGQLLINRMLLSDERQSMLLHEHYSTVDRAGDDCRSDRAQNPKRCVLWPGDITRMAAWHRTVVVVHDFVAMLGKPRG